MAGPPFSNELGDVDVGFGPALLPQALRALDQIHRRSPTRSVWPEDILKTDTGEQGIGGDAAADALRYFDRDETLSGFSNKLVG